MSPGWSDYNSSSMGFGNDGFAEQITNSLAETMTLESPNPSSSLSYSPGIQFKYQLPGYNGNNRNAFNIKLESAGSSTPRPPCQNGMFPSPNASLSPIPSPYSCNTPERVSPMPPAMTSNADALFQLPVGVQLAPLKPIVGNVANYSMNCRASNMPLKAAKENLTFATLKPVTSLSCSENPILRSTSPVKCETQMLQPMTSAAVQPSLPSDLDMNVDSLLGLDCDVNEVIRHELNVEGSLDFNFDGLSSSNSISGGGFQMAAPSTLASRNGVSSVH